VSLPIQKSTAMVESSIIYMCVCVCVYLGVYIFLLRWLINLAYLLWELEWYPYWFIKVGTRIRLCPVCIKGYVLFYRSSFGVFQCISLHKCMRKWNGNATSTCPLSFQLGYFPLFFSSDDLQWIMDVLCMTLMTFWGGQACLVVKSGLRVR
jgi:hypothetical protein